MSFDRQRLVLPPNALVLLVGSSASGKSTFATTFFAAQAVVSSDALRMVICDDVNAQDGNEQVFYVLHTIVAARLSRGLQVLVDATNLKPSARQPLYAIAKAAHAPVVALVFEISLERCRELNAMRDRQVPDHVLVRHARQMENVATQLATEPVQTVYTITPDWRETGNPEIMIEPIPTEVPHGLLIVGDIHGCFEEFMYLLDQAPGPMNRLLVSVGDLIDRGPNSVDVLRWCTIAWRQGRFQMVPGNHDNKLFRYLKGNPVKIGHGLMDTLTQLDAQPDAEDLTHEIFAMYEAAPHQLFFRTGQNDPVAICHAGMPRLMLGRVDNDTNRHCLYGEVISAKGPDGRPVRGDSWKKTWRNAAGEPLLVYGHTVTKDPYADCDQFNCRTICIDTGVPFGGKLTGFLYPEEQFISVDAERTYCEYADHEADEV